MSESHDKPDVPTPSAIYVWLVPSEVMLDQPGSWRIRKWSTEPFPEANFSLASATQDRNAIIEECAKVVDLLSEGVYESHGSTDEETGERQIPTWRMDKVEAYDDAAERIRALKESEAPQALQETAKGVSNGGTTQMDSTSASGAPLPPEQRDGRIHQTPAVASPHAELPSSEEDSVDGILVAAMDSLARRCGWNEFSSRPTICYIEDAVKYYETHLASAIQRGEKTAATETALWSRDIHEQ